MRYTSSFPARWFAFGLGCLCSVAATCADTNLPITLTGFNRDVVLENTAPTTTPYPTSLVQNFNAGENRAFYQSGFAGKSFGLPVTGMFTNSTTFDVFQFPPFTARNALILSPDTGLTNGTLLLSPPKVYNSIAILANSGNGDATGTASATLHFNDGSTAVVTYYAPDWFNNNSGPLYTVALQGVERIDFGTGATSGAPGNPRFYETSLSFTNIPGATNKALSSISFGKPNANSTGIFAVSGVTNVSQTNITFTLAVVTNQPPTSITTTGAVLNAQVLSTGNDAPMITLYYGASDGGMNPAAWANNLALGWQTGSFSQSISGLSFNSTYYFTTKAVNTAGTNWAPSSRSFATLAPTLPGITNLAATSILATSASLNGQVLSTGGDPPTVTLYYGTADGGASAAAWSNSVSIGVQSGLYIQGIFGLSANTTYYFTARATNGAGTAWATPSKSFTTLVSNPFTPSVPVLTQHNDNGRTGRNLGETLFNISNVNTNTFGLLYTRPVDDQIYAQPLIATNVAIPGKGAHNLLIVATVNDTVYAFDADDSTVTSPYWTTSFISPPNTIPPINSDMNGACNPYRDFSGNMGIVGTPVIDQTVGTIYLVARTKEIVPGVSTNFVQRLHALDITTGADKVTAAIITGTAPGSGDGGAVVSFDSQHNNQRSALTLANGRIYIAWSSHCDWNPYHGWVMAYDATTLIQDAAYCDTANGNRGGIWMSGQGPAADAGGNIYLSTGNGSVDTTVVTNRAMSFLKLDAASLNVLSWFTPYNWSTLNGGDWDLGAGGLMLIPGTSLAMGGGKSSSAFPATLYIVNKDTMGGLSAGTSDNNIVQSFGVTRVGVGFNHIHGAPVWWDGPDGSYSYVWGESDYLHQYKFDPVNGVFFLPNYARSSTYAPANGMTGGMLSISANGTNAGTGILWGSHQYSGDANQAVRPGILHAYNAQNVANELWNSEQFSARDSVGQYAKFVPPTIANGKVYLATFSGRLNVYGVLPPSRPIIYRQPQPATRFAGPTNDTVTFLAAVGGTVPLHYQWYKGASLIPGATSDRYTLANIKLSDAANYSCTITNIYGSTNTAVAALTVISQPSITYPRLVAADNPLAYWRLDESTGTTAYDYWGVYNGQYTNVQLGLSGYSSFDADTAVGFGSLSPNNSYVGNIQGIDFSTAGTNAAFSLEAWVNGGLQAGAAGIITEGYGGGGEQFNLDTGNGGRFRLSIRGATSAAAYNANGSIFPSNTWQHIVGVCNVPAGTTYLYVNGVLNATSAIDSAGVYGPPTSPLSIGARASGANSTYDLNFLGSIDEVAIYNYALTATQVLTHYRVGTNGPVSVTLKPSGNSLIVTWPLGTLQSAPTPAGPFTNMTGAVSPFMVTPPPTRQFYRVRVE